MEPYRTTVDENYINSTWANTVILTLWKHLFIKLVVLIAYVLLNLCIVFNLYKINISIKKYIFMHFLKGIIIFLTVLECCLSH